MTNIVMCPGHLVNLWKREIEDRSPGSEVIILRDFQHLISLSSKIKKTTTRFRHLWIIISKDIAKLGYDERPAAVWSSIKVADYERGVFCCPECGQPLYYEIIEGKGRNRRRIPQYLRKLSFRKQSKKENNMTCTNTINYWNEKKGQWEERTCGAKLWEPVVRENNPWVKLGKQGWFLKKHLSDIRQEILDKPKQTKEDLQLLSAINNELDGEGIPQRSPRKYPIAKYIRQYFKGCIDYVLLDEIHQLKSGDSLQGEAMGDLVQSSKKVLALTGTLLNGYSSGIYYLLYRLFAKQMKKEGYEYSTSLEFIKDYGVTKKVQWFELGRDNNIGDLNGSSNLKEMPGISPIVFTKFLLENAAFISLEDIAEALPSYEEIPIPLEMSEELEEAYKALSDRVSDVISNNKNSKKLLSTMMTLLSVFPDQPYEQPDIYDPETEEALIVPPSVDNRDLTKEETLLALIQRKLAEGEHVLVYYHWVERTDVAERLKSLFEENDIKVAVLTSSVKTEEREEWIRKQVNSGIQVLMCNPSLVETGLTLLDFTTIIYYQIGFNLYTLRQASRRSWRINQTHDVQVYFLYYKGTVQETALILMASKLQAAMTIEGKFSEEGLQAMSNNEDVMTQLATTVTEGIKDTLDIKVFEKNKHQAAVERDIEDVVKHKKRVQQISDTGEYDLLSYQESMRDLFRRL